MWYTPKPYFEEFYVIWMMAQFDKPTPSQL